jgi:carbamoyl-phosphate synthase large subunit
MCQTVVITGAGTATCQSVLKALRMQDEIPVRIITTDPDLYTAGRFLADAFERVPFASDPGFVDRLIEIAHQHKADLLIPIVDMEFLPIARRKNDFPCTVAISDESVLINCLEKNRTYRFFDELGLRGPKVHAVSGPPQDLSDDDYPLFIKPRIGRASLDCYRADNRSELEIALSKVGDPLVTEFLDGVEMTIDTISDLNARFIGGVVRVREMTKSGVSVKGLVVYNGTVLEQAQRIVEGLGIIGPACLQCYHTDAGPAWFEVNPRFGGGSILSYAAGLNSPLMLLKSVLGMPPGEFRATGVLRMMRYWMEVFVDERGRQVGCRGELVRRED